MEKLASVTIDELKKRNIDVITCKRDTTALTELLNRLYLLNYTKLRESTRNGYIPSEFEAIGFPYSSRFGGSFCIAFPAGNARVKLLYYGQE